MDGNPAFDKNLEALKRFLAMLVAMAELGTGGRFILFPQKDTAVQNIVRAQKGQRSPAFSLPRHLYHAILRLLHPAESAVRRLIVVAARGLVVTLPPRPNQLPKPTNQRGPRAFVPVGPRKFSRPDLRSPALPLLDPPWRWNMQPWKPAPTSVPRITWLDPYTPFRPLPAAPSRDDPVNAMRLARRLQALAAALEDMPGQAKRFARWRARCEAETARNKAGDTAGALVQGAFRSRRSSPLRPGRPPGGRLSRYDPLANHPRRIREIDEILAHAHALAVYALETPDTS